MSDPNRDLDPAAGDSRLGRAYLEALADRTLLALRPWASPGHARFALPGAASAAGPLSDGLEAFARSFLAAGFRLSAAEQDDHDHAGWYARGLISGTDPDSVERWPTLAEVPQARVEAAAISIALYESRAWIWDKLDATARQRIVDWLAPSAELPYPNNNWRWFCNVTQAFLRSVGGPYSQQRIDENIAAMEPWYLGDVDGHGGWYRDGAEGSIDWYNGWVMHLFALWYCRMSAGVPGVEDLQERYRGRLRDYLATAVDLFGGDGAPLFQGRSLIYRYAVAGAPWAGAVFGASPLPAGQLRRLCLRSIDFFLDRGAFDAQDLLTMGWLDRCEPMRQSYSGPGSPYWSSLGLAGLVLGADDPFWAAPAEQLPIETGDVVTVVPQAGWLVSGTHDDGIVRVINHGNDHGSDEDPLYARLAYSTATAPIDGATADSVRDRRPTAIADNQVVLISADGSRTRRSGFTLQDIAVTGRSAVASSSWGPIRCWSVIRGGVEVRAVRLDRVADGDTLVVSGYAIPQQPRPGARAGLASTARSLFGDGRTMSIRLGGSNPFGSELLLEQVEFDAPLAGRWYVVGLSLTDTGTPDPGDQVLPLATTEDDDALLITWPDGTDHIIRPDC